MMSNSKNCSLQNLMNFKLVQSNLTFPKLKQHMYVNLVTPVGAESLLHIFEVKFWTNSFTQRNRLFLNPSQGPGKRIVTKSPCWDGIKLCVELNVANQGNFVKIHVIARPCVTYHCKNWIDLPQNVLENQGILNLLLLFSAVY